MNIKIIVLCALLCLSSIKAAAGERPYAYWFEEPKWEEERTEAREEIKTAWIYLTSMKNNCWYFVPDSIISDSIIEDTRVVNGGQIHKIEYIRDGQQTHDFYYRDVKGGTLPILQGVSANNGQPYSLDEYHYIASDGLIKFSTLKFVEMVLWCLNVLVSPWLSILVFIFLGYKGIRLLKK